MYNHVNPDLNTHAPIIAKDTFDVVMANADVGAKFGTARVRLTIFLVEIERCCQTRTRLRVQLLRLQGELGFTESVSANGVHLQTLERSYLRRVGSTIVERPQHMLMRVAVGIHGSDIDSAIETYDLLSEKWFTHATPTLFNAGKSRQ